MGAIFDCLDPILTIASSLSFRDPFVMPLEQRERAQACKKAFSLGQLSDHIALLNAFDEFQQRRRDKRWADVRSWCHSNFLIADTLDTISNMRSQLAEVLYDAGFLVWQSSDCDRRLLDRTIERYSSHRNEDALLKALLVAGMYPKIAHVRLPKKAKPRRPPECRTREHGKVSIHPSSIVAGSSSGEFSHTWLVHTEVLLTQEVFLSKVSEVSEHAVLLFSGVLESDESRPHALTMDKRFFQFDMDPKVADLLLELRADMNRLLEAKLAHPLLDVRTTGAPLIDAVLRFLNEGRAPART